MKATLKISGIEFEGDEFLRITDEVSRQIQKPRTIQVAGIPGQPVNHEIRQAIQIARDVRFDMSEDVQEYLRARGIDGKYAYGAHSRLYLVFPPYPVRISPVETFAMPPSVSLVFPPGSELWLDELEGKCEVDTLFRMLNDDGIASSMRRDIWNPRIKCPELPVTAFTFEENQCNLTVHKPQIYGCKYAFDFKAWHTDTRIHGGHIENCRDGVHGVGGHNCHLYDNSFLTCTEAVNLINAQSLLIRGNVFSQENSVAKPDFATAFRLQGKNIVVDGNSIRDHQCLVGNIYGGSFSNNYISYSPDPVLQPGWLLKLSNWHETVGGTNWTTHADMKPSMCVQNNQAYRDDGKLFVQPGIMFEKGTTVHDIINRLQAGDWVKKLEVS